MKRRGYTLAEALIALTVIGVIAALVAPMANKFKPDTNKVMFLKTYDAIAQATREMASNTQFYPSDNFYPDEDDRIQYTNIPLFNTNHPVNAPSENYNGTQGLSKYCTLLSAYLDGENTNCSDDFKQIPDANETEAFTTRSGAQFWVYTESDITGENTGRYRTNIYFDINGPERGRNCTYREGVCDRPDQFMLAVDARGDIFPTDVMAERYIRTRSSYRQEGEIASLRIPEEEDFTISWAPITDSEEYEIEENQRPELPPGHVWADWVDLTNLRHTYATGVYCEEEDQYGGYSKQRHVYWHKKAQAWVEIKDVHYVGSRDYYFEPYKGKDWELIDTWGQKWW